MFLKFDDQKLSSRDDQQTPYQSACHETMQKWRNNLCDYNPTLTEQFVDVSGQTHLQGLYFISFAIIYFKILSRVLHKRTRTRMFGKLTDDI